MLSKSLAAVAAASLVAGLTAPARVVDRVLPNDNHAPAGTVRNGVLALRLVARTATWHPDGETAPGAEMAAFAEEGGAARIPGPLVRVAAGTEVEVAMRNALRDTLRVYGLHSRLRADSVGIAPLVLAPGERRTVRFRLEAIGTYYYWGTTMRRAFDFRTGEDAQLTGAMVVDDPAARRSPDRIFVIGSWADTVHRARTHRKRILGVINGRSWPNTESLTHTVGDTVAWRVINASGDLHPMHLHGFYFGVHARGNGQRDTAYAPERSDLVVTEMMPPGATIAMSWVPERAGNWLFHCHVPEHFAPRGPLGAELEHAAAHADHARGGMSGLVMGVTVRSRPTNDGALPQSAAIPARSMRLLVRPARTGYEYALHEHGPERDAQTLSGIGPTLDLVRSEPVRIMVVNRLPEPTAVHWHGIELESYFDGVPGYSGIGRRVTPMIAPGDSFDVRFTPPRAGTFIYHTHANEIAQQLAGLAGVIVVREPGAPRNSARDIPLLITERGDPASPATTTLLVNGDSAPEPIEMVARTTYRLRIVQLATTRSALRVEVSRGNDYAEWTVVAKDGADLAPSRRIPETARRRLSIGETLDVEITPRDTGALHFDLRIGLPYPTPVARLLSVPIRVRTEAQ